MIRSESVESLVEVYKDDYLKSISNLLIASGKERISLDHIKTIQLKATKSLEHTLSLIENQY